MTDMVREFDRLESLLTYGVLGGNGPDLTDIATLAAYVCGTESGAVGFLVDDRVEVHSAHGAPLCPIPRATSLSAAAVERCEPIVLHNIEPSSVVGHPFSSDTSRPRTFAAVPLVGRDGLPLGVLAVHDARDLTVTDAHVNALRVLGDHIMTRLELHRLDSWGGRTPSLTTAVQPARIRHALDAGELVPYLQPLVNLATGTTVGAEALIRWMHPDYGLITPDTFLPLIEASGLMLPVGRQIRQRALDALIEIRALGAATRRWRLSVNVSPIELARAQLATEVLDDLADRDLDPHDVLIEVTETAAFVDSKEAIAQLTALDEAGVQIALDDYGTGYSSLTRLLSLPLSTIKLDRALTARLPHDARLGVAVASTIAMAADLGLGVVAEGVETPVQASSLLAMGCNLAQGWHFGHPISLEQTLAGLVGDQAATRRIAAVPHQLPSSASAAIASVNAS